MSFVFKAPESGLGEGISAMGGILGQALQQRGQRGRERKTGTFLQEAIAKMGENPSPEQMMSVLGNVLAKGGSPELIAKFGDIYTQMERTAAPQRAEQQKATMQQMAAQQEAQNLQATIDEQVGLIKKGSIGSRIASPLAWLGISEGGQERAQFDTLALSLESKLKEALGKGQMSDARFKYLKDRLPSSTSTDRENIGKLKAIAKELNLDPSSIIELEKSYEAPEKGNVILKKGDKVLSFPPEVAEELLQQGWTR